MTENAVLAQYDTTLARIILRLGVVAHRSLGLLVLDPRSLAICILDAPRTCFVELRDFVFWHSALRNLEGDFAGFPQDLSREFVKPVRVPVERLAVLAI